MYRRYGEPPRKNTRYRRRVGVYAILPRAGALLLTHQAEPDDEVQLPGGGVDPGESPLQALHREVWEETGWTISSPRRLGAFRRYVYMPEYDMHAEKVCLIYRATPIRMRGAPSEPGHAALWAEPRAALDLLGNAGDSAFLRRWVRAP